MFTADEYCKQHDHIRYCEIIIHKDGIIEESRPSHQKALIKATGLDEEVLWDMIPIYDDVMCWLCEYTGCVCVWYDMIQGYPLSEAQIETLNILNDNKITDIPKEMITCRIVHSEK